MDHLPTPIGERGPVRFLNMAVGDRGLLAKGHIHPSQGHRRWKSLCT
jgi:hypothetical protein